MAQARSPRGRPRWPWIVALVLLVPIVVIGGFGLFLAGEAGMLPWQVDPTRIPITPFAGLSGSGSRGAASPAAATGTPTRTGATPLASPAVGGAPFEIVGAESSASYVAQEELADVGANTAIGTTNAVAGQIVLGPDGAPVAGGQIEVDLRTLTSDESRRDNFLRRDTLQTDTYPLATFVISGVEDWPGPLVEGEEASFTLLGELTVHGVTNPVAWQATATRRGDTVEGTATTTIQMRDFDITPPKVGPVLSIDEAVKLELKIIARPAAGT